MKGLQKFSTSEDKNAVTHNILVYDSNEKHNTGYALENVLKIHSACFGQSKNVFSCNYGQKFPSLL